jgi:iron complex transport system substrate-binding protein
VAQAPAQRVISLVPAATELIEAMGAGDRLIGVGRHDTSRAGRGLPRLGGPADPSLERIVALDPDLVVVWDGITAEATLRRLEVLGSRVYRARIETFADLDRTARALGRHLGRAGPADSLGTAIRGVLDSLRARPVRERPSVLVVLHPAEPLLTAGPGTYLDELVRVAGFRNTFADAPVPWPLVSPETVVARQPHALVVTDEQAAEGVLDRAPWRLLSAVREGRVLRLPRARLLHPGPASADVARAMARFLDRIRREGSD